MHRNAFIVALLLLSVGASAQTRSNQWTVGTYKLPKESPTPGTLTIRSVHFDTVEFDLIATKCIQQCDDEAQSVNNYGQIDRGTMRITGSSGTYVSSEDEDDVLGHCVLHFTRTRYAITVRQASRCWWFGDRVEVSGTYRVSTESSGR